MIRLSALLIISQLAVMPKIMAQCNVLKTVSGNITRTETPENYFYTRTKTVYNSAAVKMISLTKGSTTKTGLNIKFTTSYINFKPQALTLNFVDAATIAHTLTFKSKRGSDNPQITSQEFEVFLTPDDVARLRARAAKSLLFTGADKMFVEIPLNDGSLFQQQVSCLEK